MKKAIRYLRFSSDGQSNHSIDRQDMITAGWTDHNKIAVVDTFIDEGYSARTFDRPDMKLLMDFIKKNYRTIDYLVVAELTRFSREAGDAINMVKEIQKTYGINIVSAGRSCIYDVYDSNSFFMMGLEFLLGNSENIKRQNDINGGIYTAKIEGRWIQGGPAPFGFKKEGAGKDRHLVISEPEAAIVRFIYTAFINNTPAYIIADDAKKMGMKRTNNSIIQDILKNPLYMGLQNVKSWKDKAGGLFPLSNFTAIIDKDTWYRAQEKFKPRPRVSVAENFPLRQVLKCWCRQPVTGAPSRSKSGKYISYYKCKHRGHVSLNVNKAHDQLDQVLELLSLPDRLVKAIQLAGNKIMEEQLKENRSIAAIKKVELDAVENKLHSLEEKFISNQLAFDSYNKWQQQYRQERSQLQGQISKLDHDENHVYFLLQQNLHRLTDLKGVFHAAQVPGKQELIRQVFDSSLYYQNSAYRTPYLMPVFHHNINTLSEKQLLHVDGFDKNLVMWTPADLYRTPFIDFLSLVSSIRVA